MKIRALLPLVLFMLVAMILWRGLALHAQDLPSPLISKSAPDFSLPELFNPRKLVTQAIFQGQVTMLNVWSASCVACAEEHPFLMSIAHQQGFKLTGLSYEDAPKVARQWLQANGNPYTLVISDQTGSAAIDFGVYGTPETFIIDKKSKIRFRQTGAIDQRVWSNTLWPLIKKLEKE